MLSMALELIPAGLEIRGVAVERNELAYLVGLHSIDGIGNRSLGRIKQYFGSFENCFLANSQDMAASFLKPEIGNKIVQARYELNPFHLLDEITARGILITALGDSDYPSLLTQIHDPPHLLYYQGQIEILDSICIAVVGSRQASNYGRSQSRRFGRELAARGIVVISGMARGIDTEAHRGALEAEGKTAAILGSGLDYIYPPENVQLFREISIQGVVISEFPPHAHPEAGNFPVRNRLISGLSQGILVVEARQRSGALITADFALEQGRDVFAIPGPVDKKNSVGTNHLIKQGAALVTDPDDILQEYLPGSEKAKEFIQDELFALNHIERQILDSLADAAVHFDDIMYNTALSVGLLSTNLLQMELKGIIKALPGNYYQRTGTQ